MPTASGFPGERLRVLPRPRIAEALLHPVTSRLVVTDCGSFPRAADHQLSRPSGSPEGILIVCVDGAGWCEVEGRVHHVGPARAVVLPPGVPHAYGASAADPWTVWWMHVGGADAAALLAANGASSVRPVVPVHDVTRAVELVDEALRAMERDDSPASLQLAAGSAWHLLALLSTAPTMRARSSDPVSAAIDHMHRNVDQPLSVRELAASLNLSESHFGALFRKATGYPPRGYLMRLRMMRARELLDATDLPVSLIARRVGYADPLYFSRLFRAVHGITATQHRERVKG